MTASALGKIFYEQNLDITLIESEAVGTVSVGEATIPQISVFNRLLGIRTSLQLVYRGAL
jgi:tryptophan 7-halogenase